MTLTRTGRNRSRLLLTKNLLPGLFLYPFMSEFPRAQRPRRVLQLNNLRINFSITGINMNLNTTLNGRRMFNNTLRTIPKKRGTGRLVTQFKLRRQPRNISLVRRITVTGRRPLKLSNNTKNMSRHHRVFKPGNSKTMKVNLPRNRRLTRIRSFRTFINKNFFIERRGRRKGKRVIRPNSRSLRRHHVLCRRRHAFTILNGMRRFLNINNTTTRNVRTPDNRGTLINGGPTVTIING